LLHRAARRPGDAGTVESDYTATLVEGVVAHWRDINELLATYSQGWSVERMPAVDRAILRLGHLRGALQRRRSPRRSPSVRSRGPSQVDLSTDESPKFVNGLLGRLAQVKPTLA
jgi:N utilization substance protein B